MAALLVIPISLIFAAPLRNDIDTAADLPTPPSDRGPEEVCPARL